MAVTVPSSLFVASLKIVLQRALTWRHRAAYILTVALFFWLVSAFYLPGKGFTAFLSFGDQVSAGYLPSLSRADVYIEEDSHGYDAQHYAQIAMQPDVRDPALTTAVDNVSYRARRILFSGTAWALGFGDPMRTVHVFAVQNIVCWLGLAILLLRWFPAKSWENYLRWVGLMFSYGMWFSVRGALVDGPSLLLIAGGVALVEARRPWIAAIVLGISGLAKETNILAGGIIATPATNSRRGWMGVAGRSALVLLPLAVWTCLLWRWFGDSGGTGLRNFAGPLLGYFEKWRSISEQMNAEYFAKSVYSSLLWMIAATVQFLFLIIRPQLGNLWWRVGASFAVLFVFLGDAVWEGDPGAAARVLLPMALAFNILVPRGRGWLPVLLLGNLTIFSTPENMRLPGSVSYEVHGARELKAEPRTKEQVEVRFIAGWYKAERSRGEYWRWSNGQAELRLYNPHAYPLTAEISWGLKSIVPREVTVQAGEQVLWKGHVTRETTQVRLKSVQLPPGETTWLVGSDREAIRPSSEDTRPVAFSLRNFRIELEGRVR